MMMWDGKISLNLRSQEDLKLILSALSAYQHNPRYRVLYERLLAEQERAQNANGTVCARVKQSLRGGPSRS